ncbi:MAG: methyltransferase domain-containing protein [Acidobacteria bacterium]|nr:methyltransferase domain-containing protein [Acidobacteriota bacterium]
MRNQRSRQAAGLGDLRGCGAALASGLILATIAHAAAQVPSRNPDVAFTSAPPAIVDAMLDLARVTSDDVVYDLGCGDGRIVIAAAKNRGARGVGIDIDPARIADATALALREGMTARVTFVLGDLFEAQFADATVVMLYLQPEPNLRLRQRLLTELRPGTRVVSLSYDMGDWTPDAVRRIGGRRIYLWTIPARP